MRMTCEPNDVFRIDGEPASFDEWAEYICLARNELVAKLIEKKEAPKRLEELYAQITPGPWHVSNKHYANYIWNKSMQMIMDEDGGALRLRGVGYGLPMDINCEFICLAINTLIHLPEDIRLNGEE